MFVFLATGIAIKIKEDEQEATLALLKKRRGHLRELETELDNLKLQLSELRATRDSKENAENIIKIHLQIILTQTEVGKITSALIFIIFTFVRR